MSYEGQSGALGKIDCSRKRRLELASLTQEEGVTSRGVDPSRSRIHRKV